MKIPLQKLDADTIRRDYPVTNLVEGWFFRHQETSSLHYVVEGTDLWGRHVGADGSDLDLLLQQCAEAARRIDHETGLTQ
jgi:hypothetical protein